jgi:hypothetical protein
MGRKRVLLDQVLDDQDIRVLRRYLLNLEVALEQARNSLGYLRTLAMRFKSSRRHLDRSFSDPAKRVAEARCTRRVCPLSHLQQWSTAFESFIQDKADFDVAGQEAIHVLKMHRTRSARW